MFCIFENMYAYISQINLMCMSLVAQSCPTLCNPMYCSPPYLCLWNFPGKNTGSGLPFPSPGDLPYPEIEPRSPTLQADALPSELPGKPHVLWKSLINIAYSATETLKENGKEGGTFCQGGDMLMLVCASVSFFRASCWTPSSSYHSLLAQW